MIYQVEACYFFEKEDEAMDFFHDCEVALPKAIVVNPDTLAEEDSWAELRHCRHDTTPPNPCDVIEHIDNKPD